jgi:Ni/Fe-hydrogenase subunit HybB-like protein
MKSQPGVVTSTHFRLWTATLLIIMLAGAVAAANVFIRGLAITNLTDLVPWGLWIAIDLSSIALGAGAFMLSAAVYLLGLKQYQPVARTAVYIGLIGYSMAMMMLLLDIGRPDRFWHGFVFWNPHSPLWEVTMCVGLYFSVLILETLPIFAGSSAIQSRWPKLAGRVERIHHIAPILAVAGLGLSMLHQSSLGAVYGVLVARPIWYRPGLAVLFIVSAMAAGPALTILASMVAARVSPRANVNENLLHPISRFIGWVLVAYLYLRFWDAFSMTYTYEPGRTEGLNLLTGGTLSFNFWIGEVALGIIVPMIILLNNRLRRNQLLHVGALMLVVGGLVAYRWDTNLVGQLVLFNYVPQELIPRYTQYFPSLIEFLAGAGAIAYGLMAFTLGVRFLKVVDHGEAPQAVARPARVAGSPVVT